MESRVFLTISRRSDRTEKRPVQCEKCQESFPPDDVKNGTCPVCRL